ncbi:hypothetical protein EGC86_18455 [Shewanella frigidimarina]|uniref:hypothetical protein n=1 Tax=Shewanella frigidimarina TaxID=56812 RepID=UPI000F4DB348|nr:hypothetical protein [Shewanella frigidimarina]RPA58880.1 hypothetical protein EGC86_18455 [Shewanella frigidimarina]
MPITVPDSSWYRAKSSEAGVACSCPYANVHKCHRYYASVYMLGEVRMITSISDDKKSELDEFWNQSGLAPVIAEEDTGVSGSEGKSSSFSNFCPEVSYKYFRYYASYLSRYVDEIDKDSGQRIAERENIEGDWRYEWQFLSACHYLECSVYDQVDEFNSKGIGKFDQLAHSNIVVLIGRMENCLESNDPSGVLHAASNILETMAKDVLGDERLANQTLGSFIDKYKNESSLPVEIKNVVGNIYNLRNKMPLSGHGSTDTPNINMQDAIVIAATTKFIVEIEYRTKII